MQNEETALIVRGVLSLGRRLRAERPRGSVSLSAIGILSTLKRLGPLPAVRLAAEERLQPQSLTRLIMRLEQDGLIARKPGELDRRQILITATPRGLQLLSNDIRARRKWLEQAMQAGLTDDERLLLLEASKLMFKLAGQAPSVISRQRVQR
jgi:DNA-binding MarR family transcriptional regulator